MRLHAALLAHAPNLAAAGALLAAGDIDGAHESAASLAEATAASAAAAVDEVLGLEATLSCCRAKLRPALPPARRPTRTLAQP